MTDKDYTALLLEEIRDQNKAVLELLRAIPTISDFRHLEQRVDDLRADVKVIKAAVTDLSFQGNDHERRITRLETA
jgi:DNA-binding HxlR family transcriptional regulator